MPEFLKTRLFVIPETDVKSSKALSGAFNYNLNDGLLLQNCCFTAESPLLLCNNISITKINTILKNVSFDKEVPRIKKITGNYVLDDNFSDMYHIEAADGTVITIPDEIEIGTRELYFRKLDPASKIYIKSKKLHSLPGTLILDQTKTQVILYKHEGFFYGKNLL